MIPPIYIEKKLIHVIKVRLGDSHFPISSHIQSNSNQNRVALGLP